MNTQAQGRAIGIDRAMLARAVRERRGDRALREVAPEVGLSFAGIARIERAEGSPNADNYVRLCDWIGVPVDRFVKRAAA